MQFKKIKKAVLAIGLAACCLINTGCKGKTLPGNIGDVTFADGDLIAEIEIENYGTMKAKLFPDIAEQAVDNFQKLVNNGYYNGLKIHYVMPDNRIQGGSLYGDGTGGSSPLNLNGYFENETSADARHFYGALCMANELGHNTTQFYIVNSKKTDDITKYSADKIKEKAAEYTAKKEGMESDDPDYESVVFYETYYTNLANMISGASEEVKAKYASAGGVPMWDGKSTVFGQIYEGLDVLDKISAVEITTDKNGEVCRPISDIVIKSIKITKYETPQPEPEPEESKKGNKKKK